MTVCTSDNPSQEQSVPRKWTKVQVLSLARRKWPNATLREMPGAATKQQREENQQKRRELVAKRDAAIAEMKAMGDAIGQLRKLLDAVRFCCDVDAGEPSLSQLKEARAAADRFIELLDTKPTRQEIGALDCFTRRFTLLVPLGRIGHEVKAQGDTLADIAAALSKGGAQ